MISVHYIYTPHQSRVTAVCRHAPCPPIFSPACSGSFPVSCLIAVCPVFSGLLSTGLTGSTVWFSARELLIFTLIFLFLLLTSWTLKFYSRNNNYRVPINYTNSIIHRHTIVQQSLNSRLHPSPDQDFRMTLWRWRPMRGSSVHQHVPKGAHWISKRVSMPHWSFQLCFLCYAAQISSAFSLCL